MLVNESVNCEILFGPAILAAVFLLRLFMTTMTAFVPPVAGQRIANIKTGETMNPAASISQHSTVLADTRWNH